MTKTSLWALVDERHALGARTMGEERGQRLLTAIPVLVLVFALGVAVWIPATLADEARLALFGFGTAIVLWSLTGINAAYVALGAILLLVLGGGLEQEELFETLESDVIWLMIGAFVLGAAVKEAGLAGRLTGLVARRARTVGGMLWLVTLALIPSAFVIPSTSGRAAVAMPIFRSLSDAAGDRRVTRALGLLIPTVILTSTIASLTGAGSHLIANDLLDEVTDAKFSFLTWLLYGAPFGIAASLISAWVVGRLFLTREHRRRPLNLKRQDAKPLSQRERVTIAVILASVALWSSESLHGLEIATVSVIAAFVLTLPGFGVISWKKGLGAVSWNLVLFVGCALVLGEALIETGAAEWLIDGAFEASGLTGGGSQAFLLLSLALVTLTSHLYMTSHAARAAALVPPLLYLGSALELQLAAVMFIGTVGMNYCLTFPVSSKALLLFQEADRDNDMPADMLRLSAVLLPLHAVLMLLFYFLWWRPLGLSL
nr:SLC13 family permease [uncultured Sphingomonas sp.]